MEENGLNLKNLVTLWQNEISVKIGEKRANPIFLQMKNDLFKEIIFNLKMKNCVKGPSKPLLNALFVFRK